MNNYLTTTQAVELFTDGILAFSRAEQVGMRIDVDYCYRKKKEIQSRIKELEDKFSDSPTGKLWIKVFSNSYINKKGRKFTSNDQLSHILFNLMKVEPIKETDKGRASTDDESLSQLSLTIPELEYCLQMRKLDKIEGTYLNAFIREQVDGVLHCSFDLNTTTSLRSSGNSPNLQNIPKHDNEAQEICRSAIYPRKGHQFIEFDYSGQEVRVAGALTNDQKLIYDILHGDMHKDMAMELYVLKELDKKSKEGARIRYTAKNGFVFPEFYGSYYKNCAPNLIKLIEGAKLENGELLLVHLAKKGLVKLSNGKVTDISGFVEHVRKVEDQFWNVRYKTYKEWKDKMWAKYQEEGYVRLVTGFTCRDVMTRNEMLNRPMQGPAFHCLLWSFTEIDKYIIENNLDSRLVGQIHDSLLIDANPKETEELAKVVKKIMCEDIRKEWSWLTVPLDTEASISGINKSWFEQRDYKI